MSVQAAQSLKTGTHKALGSKAYGELKGATIEAEKALTRGLKEEIEGVAKKLGVDLGAINAREGAAIQAAESVAKRVAQVGNREPVGLLWLAANPGMFLAGLAEKSPVVKSLVARGLYNEAARIGRVPVETVRWAVGAMGAPQEPK